MGQFLLQNLQTEPALPTRFETPGSGTVGEENAAAYSHPVSCCLLWQHQESTQEPGLFWAPLDNCLKSPSQDYLGRGHQGPERQRKTEELSRIQGDERDSTANEMCDPGWGPD